MKTLILCCSFLWFGIHTFGQSSVPAGISVIGDYSQLLKGCAYSFTFSDIKELIPQGTSYFNSDGSLKSNFIYSVFWETKCDRLIPFDPDNVSDRNIPEYWVENHSNGSVTDHTGFWTDMDFLSGATSLDKILINVLQPNGTSLYLAITYLKIQNKSTGVFTKISLENLYIEQNFLISDPPSEPTLTETGDHSSLNKKVKIVLNDFTFGSSNVGGLTIPISTQPNPEGLEASFKLTSCGAFQYYVRSKFTCPSGYNDLKITNVLDIGATAPFEFQVVKSDIPFDKAYSIKTDAKNVKFKWQKLVNNNWETKLFGNRFPCTGIEPIRVFGESIYPQSGCLPIQSDVIFPTATNIGKSNSISINILKNGFSKGYLLDPSKVGIEYTENITFTDDIGRPIQSKAIAAGNEGQDIIQHFIYENIWGRQLNNYLPYTSTNQQGRGVFDPNAATNQVNFYKTNPDVPYENKPFSNVVYDDTKDISKIIKSYGPGQAWDNPSTGVDKFVSQDGYLFKASEFNNSPVYRLFWSVPGNNQQEKAMTDNDASKSQTYLDEELVVKESKSEDGQFSYEFVNNFGQTVATRTMPLKVNSTQKPLTTYYVYDDFGRLRMKIPPKVSALFGVTSSVIYIGSPTNGKFLQLATDVASGPLVEALCTRYVYDGKGRLIKEFKPGGGYVETVYDLLNRPVMSQDQSQRMHVIGYGQTNKWSFIKYDRLGRQVITGELNLGYYTYSELTTRALLQYQVDGFDTWYEKRDNSQTNFHGYTNQAFPDLTGSSVVGYTLLTVDYYDDYNFKRGNGFDRPVFDPTVQNQFPWNTTVLDPRPNLCSDLKSLQTGHKVRVLGSEGSGEWLLDLMVYDEKERLIASFSDNAFSTDGMGQDDRNYTKYNNDYGHIEINYSTHSNNISNGGISPDGSLYTGNQSIPASIVQIKKYAYNDRHQLKTITMKINGQDEKELIAYDYDVFGNVKTKHLCGKLQHLDYKRDIRGRLTHINDPAVVGVEGGAHSAATGGLPADADIFGMKLVRENITSEGTAHTSTTANRLDRFDGTITGQQWKSLSDQISRSFSYQYDDFNRVKKADYRAKDKSTGAPWGGIEVDKHSFTNASYDDNGNIKQMSQLGPISKTDPTTSTADNLTYNYESVSGIETNKLNLVSEAAAKYLPKGPGESSFRRDFNSNSTLNYVYDEAGRLTKDPGKSIKSIGYNLLDLPETIEFNDATKKIKTVYASDGRKLKYIYESEPVGGGPVRSITTWYAAGFQYRIHSAEPTKDLVFLNTEAGKAVYYNSTNIGLGDVQDTWLHQFHINDHQGNLRVAFQESYTKTTSKAGMEQIDAVVEEEEFNFVQETRQLNIVQSRSGKYISALNPMASKPIGPMKWMAVEQGDIVEMEAYAHYDLVAEPQTATWQTSLAGFLVGSLANTIYNDIDETGAPNAAMQQLVLLGTTLAANALPSFQQPPTVPRAYMKWIHYDRDSQFISQGFVPITTNAQGGYELLSLQKIAEQDGFVQFFVANESLRNVYFDDITTIVRKPRIIQEGHYNPFGLPLAGLTTLGNPEYAYFFTGKELYEDEALQWYNYGARMYDVQIGRWTTHDPVYQYASPYTYCGNNGVNVIDPTGMYGWDDLWKDVATLGMHSVYTEFIRGSHFDHWLAKNEAEIVTGLISGVGIALCFTPMSAGGAFMANLALGTLQGGMYGGGEEGYGKGFMLGMASGAIGGAIGSSMAESILVKSPFLNGAIKGAIGGLITGAAVGAIGADMSHGNVLRGALFGGVTGALMGAAVGGSSEAVSRHKEGWGGFSGKRRQSWLDAHKVDNINIRSGFPSSPLRKPQLEMKVLADTGPGPYDNLIQNPDPSKFELGCVGKCAQWSKQRISIDHIGSRENEMLFGASSGIMQNDLVAYLKGKGFVTTGIGDIDFSIDGSSLLNLNLDAGNDIMILSGKIFGNAAGYDHATLLNRVQYFGPNTYNIQLADPSSGTIRSFFINGAPSQSGLIFKYRW